MQLQLNMNFSVKFLHVQTKSYVHCDFDCCLDANYGNWPPDILVSCSPQMSLSRYWSGIGHFVKSYRANLHFSQYF